MTGGKIVALLALLPALPAAAGDDIGNSLFWLELRPRYNHIEESDKPLTTHGGTLRAVAGWRSAPWYGLRFTAEGIYADRIGPKHFSDEFDPTSPYPLLPDPRYTGVNRLHVDVVGIDDVVVRAGRQSVTFDNKRWVSENDFRQIPQLFDGVSAKHTGLANVELAAGYFRRVRTTSGDTAELKLTVAHVAWNPLPEHSISAYGYFHDQPATANFTGFADNSYRLIGVRAEGVAARVGDLEIPYEAEIAQQKPYADGDGRIDARYWRVGTGVAGRTWLVRADYEVRGSNNGQYGLQAPLTDFYAFNGWTLHFFTLPRQGLRDRWLTGRWTFSPITLYGELHRFRSDFGGLDFGDETDVGATWEILPNAILRLQHARYDPGAGRPEAAIRKTWLTFTYTY